MTTCSIQLRARASGDQLLDPRTLPWVPQADGVYFRPLRICPELGTWTNLLRVTRQGTINLHRHIAPVEAWVISGEWRYLERDSGWPVQGPMYSSRLVTSTRSSIRAEEEMVTLFSMHGAIEYIGPNGETIFTETAETKRSKYASFCEAHEIPLAPIIG